MPEAQRTVETGIFYLGRLRGMGRDFGLGGFQDVSRKEG